MHFQSEWVYFMLPKVTSQLSFHWYHISHVYLYISHISWDNNPNVPMVKDFSVLQYRVAAIFPEQFQRLTYALKNHIFINYFAEICLSSLPKCKQKQTDTFRQRWTLWIILCVASRVQGQCKDLQQNCVPTRLLTKIMEVMESLDRDTVAKAF